MAASLSQTAEIRLRTLSRKPRAGRRLAVMADAELAVAVLGALTAAGYAVDDAPEDTQTLRAALAETEGETVMLNDYAAFQASLPAALRDAVAARWGAAERDPQFHPGRVDCGRFIVPALRFGAVAVIAAAVAENPPRHHSLARWTWIIDAFRADAVIARQPLGFALSVPVLVPVPGAPDLAALPAALDGDSAALRRWQPT